jgi:preprotein translocase subunit SecG
LWLVESDRRLGQGRGARHLAGVGLGQRGAPRRRAYTDAGLRRRGDLAAGAFNWQVKVGDKVSITDYRGSRGTLTSERSPAELGWSLAQRVPASTVDGSARGQAGARRGGRHRGGAGQRAPPQALRRLAWVFTVLVLLINVPIAVMGGLYSWVMTARHRRAVAAGVLHDGWRQHVPLVYIVFALLVVVVTTVINLNLQHGGSGSGSSSRSWGSGSSGGSWSSGGGGHK